MDIVSKLRELALNLRWVWQPNVVAIFRDIAPELWRNVNHNPMAFLAAIPPERLEMRATAIALESRVSFAFHRLREYLELSKGWKGIALTPLQVHPVAYFSAEFGLHESLPIYSGGLGILAGDHVKSASFAPPIGLSRSSLQERLIRRTTRQNRLFNGFSA